MEPTHIYLRKYLLPWVVFCLVITMAGILIPVRETRSLGLEGANQANLRAHTEELTEGRLLEFTLDLPSDTSKEIGFFFTVNQHTFTTGVLHLSALEEGTLLEDKSFPLKDLTEDQFLFLPLGEAARAADTLTVHLYSDALSQGPSVWLNETTITPGGASFDGVPLSQSLVYNLTYTVQVHHYQKPVLIGLILLFVGIGVYSVGGFVPGVRKSRKGQASWFVMPSVKEVLFLMAAGLLTAVLFFYLYDTQIRIAQNTTEKASVLKSDGGTLLVNKAHATVSQIVKPKEDSLTGLGVPFYLQEGVALTEGTMHAKVTDLTLKGVMCETDIQASRFISGEYIGLLFDESQTGVQDHVYRIDLTFSPELWDSGLAVMTSAEGLCVNAYLYFNIFLKKFFFFIFLGVELFLCIFWYMAFVYRASLENVFLVTILFFGLVYNVMLTPQMVPDEAKHIDMAYRYSNELLGYESLGDMKCLMRADDAALEFTASPSFANYRNIYYGLFSQVQDSSMVEAQVSSNIEGSFFLYAPAVLGMTLARMLGWGTVPMLLFARYLTLAVFALLTYFGMKRLPFGKMTLFVLAVLPVNMQQCTSFSHDAMVHGILFFYCCLCLQAIFSRERLTGQRMLLLFLTEFFLIYCKSGSYAPLCILPCLIPPDCYGSRKRKMMGMVSLMSIPVLAFFMKNVQMMTGIVSTTAATSVVSTGNGAEYLTGYTVGYFLKDPLELIYMMANTFFDKTGFYLESLIGYKLGWVEIETSMMMVLLFWFLLFLSVCDRSEDRIHIHKGQRFWIIFACLGCTGLILMGMLLQWTPMGHVSVEGVQGRYFLPFMPVLLTACKNRVVVLKGRIDRGIAVAAVTGQLLTLACMIRQVTMV